MARLVQLGSIFVVIVGLIVLLDSAMHPSGSPIQDLLVSVRDVATQQY
jgi:hypothetical protein